jgi:hypothetical protein
VEEFLASQTTSGHVPADYLTRVELEERLPDKKWRPQPKKKETAVESEEVEMVEVGMPRIGPPGKVKKKARVWTLRKDISDPQTVSDGSDYESQGTKRALQHSQTRTEAPAKKLRTGESSSAAHTAGGIDLGGMEFEEGTALDPSLIPSAVQKVRSRRGC